MIRLPRLRARRCASIYPISRRKRPIPWDFFLGSPCRETGRMLGSPPSPKDLGEDASLYKCPLLGGDTVKTGGPLTISITAIGTVPNRKMVFRDAVEAGDIIYVTGTIGDAALGLKLRLGAASDRDWISALERERFCVSARSLSSAAAAPRATRGACRLRSCGDGCIGWLCWRSRQDVAACRDDDRGQAGGHSAVRSREAGFTGRAPPNHAHLRRRGRL